MRLRCLLLVLLAMFLYCPKKYVPKVDKIEAVYLASIYQDIYRDVPLLSGIKGLPGIKIGYLKTDPPFLAVILERLGIYRLLNDTGIDFVIGDLSFFGADDINYFFIPISMGYALKNYQGIRFAIFSKDQDILTIDDEIKMSLVEQRSDVLWIIDKNLTSASPMKINFFIKDRGLVDTTTATLKIVPDTMLLKKIRNFKDRFAQILNQKIFIGHKKFDDYILSKVADNEGVNVILYPENLFCDVSPKDSISLQEILGNVICDLKFKKYLKMAKKEILAFNKEKKYRIWGNLKVVNQILLPDNDGAFLFDILSPVDLPKIY